MADIASFPTIRNVLWTSGTGANVHKFIATTAVKAGQVVAFAATGVSGAVIPSLKGTTGQPIGVALYGAAAGDSVTVACDGCIVYVANAESDVDIDAGDNLEPNDNATGPGAVSAIAVQAGGTVTGLVCYMCGIAIDDITRSLTGRMLVKCGYMTKPQTA
jgi:hypothetical protein